VEPRGATSTWLSGKFTPLISEIVLVTVIDIKLYQLLIYATSKVTTVIEVRSASARLFAGTWRPWWVLLQHCVMLRRLVFLSSSVVWRAFCALCVYSKFGHHPHP